MKIIKISLLSFAMVAFASCENAADKIKNGNEAAMDASPSTPAQEMVSQEGTPEFSFEEEFHDFGEIQEGKVVEHVFVFTNTGDSPLIISNARGSCGCTVPQWPNEPIAPGDKGEIRVSFNSAGRSGQQDKQVTLTANTVPNTKVLKITSTVVGGAETE
ncbi:MAG: DUF1573 domain-containing protein [Bacteroidota bacterium]|nr:DUF1573 domain-containing protein [Bacteroidota bacterium]